MSRQVYENPTECGDCRLPNVPEGMSGTGIQIRLFVSERPGLPPNVPAIRRGVFVVYAGALSDDRLEAEAWKGGLHG